MLDVPVSHDAEELLAAGNDALARGAWPAARDAFVALGEDPEAQLGLGVALWWLGDMGGVIEHLEKAYAAFRRRPDPALAAMCAIRLGFHCSGHLANPAAAAGWLARGARLIEQHALEPLRGELLLMQAYVDADPVVGERLGRDALELGRRAGDLDLELCAMSQIGLSLVEQGRVAEGIALLDEAMAGCVGGEPGSLETVAFASCRTMVACARCADFERTMQWVRATERFAERHGAPFLDLECRVIYASVLLARGELRRAEDEARAAIEVGRGRAPAYDGQAVAILAKLRLAQGRLEEAERLLVGLEGQPAIVEPLAMTQLGRGHPELAASTVQRRLDMLGAEGIERALLLEILGEAEIAQGKHEAAADRGTGLADLGQRLGCRVILARGARLRGHALAHGDAAAARLHLDRALAVFVEIGMPFEAARTRLRIAQALRSVQPAIAAAEARAALTVFEEVGAGGEADAAAALLRQLGVKAARIGPRGLETLTKREREVLALLGEGLSNPEIAGRLFISRKTVEHHVASILAKLGLRSRAEAAAEAVRRPR